MTIIPSSNEDLMPLPFDVGMLEVDPDYTPYVYSRKSSVPPYEMQPCVSFTFTAKDDVNRDYYYKLDMLCTDDLMQIDPYIYEHNYSDTVIKSSLSEEEREKLFEMLEKQCPGAYGYSPGMFADMAVKKFEYTRDIQYLIIYDGIKGRLCPEYRSYAFDLSRNPDEMYASALYKGLTECSTEPVPATMPYRASICDHIGSRYPSCIIGDDYMAEFSTEIVSRVNTDIIDKHRVLDLLEAYKAGTLVPMEISDEYGFLDKPIDDSHLKFRDISAHMTSAHFSSGLTPSACTFVNGVVYGQIDVPADIKEMLQVVYPAVTSDWYGEHPNISENLPAYPDSLKPEGLMMEVSIHNPRMMYVSGVINGDPVFIANEGDYASSITGANNKRWAAAMLTEAYVIDKLMPEFEKYMQVLGRDPYSTKDEPERDDEYEQEDNMDDAIDEEEL